MPRITEPITTLEPGGHGIDVSLVFGAATSTAVSSLASRVTAVEESGGSEPDLSRGPFLSGVMLELTKITEFTASQLGIPAGNEATIGVRVQGRTATVAGVTRSLQFTVQNIGGVLSTIAFDAGADITAGSLSEAESGWSTAVRIRADGGAVEVLGLSPEAVSNWLAFAWLASLVPLSTVGLTDTAPEVTMTVPAPALALAVPVRWMSTVGITGWYASQVDTLPADPVWLLSPAATVSVGGSGQQTIYYWGRTATGVVTARKQLTVNVVLDNTPPTITAFALPDTSDELTVAITSLTASEDVTWFYNFTGVLPTTPTWAVAPSTISFPDWGAYIVSMWARDVAGNVSQVATQAITVADMYFVDLFNGATLGSGWVPVDGGAAELTGTGELRRIGSGGWRGVAHYAANTLPANLYMTWRFPSASFSSFLGFALQLAGDASSCVQVSWVSDDRSEAPRCGWGAPSFTLTNATVVVDSGIPASWAGTGVHQVTIGVVNGATDATYTVYLNGQAYGHFTGPLAVAGRGITVLGNPDNSNGLRLFYDVQVTPTLPAYNSTP